MNAPEAPARHRPHGHEPDGYIARRDGGVDWMAVQDEFPTGAGA